MYRGKPHVEGKHLHNNFCFGSFFFLHPLIPPSAEGRSEPGATLPPGAEARGRPPFSPPPAPRLRAHARLVTEPWRRDWNGGGGERGAARLGSARGRAAERGPAREAMRPPCPCPAGGRREVKRSRDEGGEGRGRWAACSSGARGRLPVRQTCVEWLRERVL